MTCQTPDVDPPEFPVYVDAQATNTRNTDDEILTSRGCVAD